MITTQPHSSSESLEQSNVIDPHHTSRSSVTWGAIFAGTIAAIAVYVLYMMLAAGLGLAIYSPVTDQNPVASLSIGALIIHSIGAIVSLCLGGWVAGHFTSVRTRSNAWLHGFCVWCAATVGGALLVTMGAGWMLSGLTSLAGSGLSAAGQSVGTVADGAFDLAGDAMEQSGNTIQSFVDEAVSALSDDAPEHERIRATREIGFAVGRLFNPMREGNTPANRAAAVDALVEHTDMSQPEAERAVSDWTHSFERLQDDLEAAGETAATQAREAADSTASALSTFSLWAFGGFLLGALAAAFGGHLGAQCATKCEEKTGQVYVADPAHNV